MTEGGKMICVLTIIRMVEKTICQLPNKWILLAYGKEFPIETYYQPPVGSIMLRNIRRRTEEIESLEKRKRIFQLLTYALQ